MNGGPYGSRTRLFRLKSWPVPNVVKDRFDFSCIVLGMKNNGLAASRLVIINRDSVATVGDYSTHLIS